MPASQPVYQKKQPFPQKPEYFLRLTDRNHRSVSRCLPPTGRKMPAPAQRSRFSDLPVPLCPRERYRYIRPQPPAETPHRCQVLQKAGKIPASVFYSLFRFRRRHRTSEYPWQPAESPPANPYYQMQMPSNRKPRQTHPH